VSRAEFLKIVFGVLHIPSAASSHDCFPDVHEAWQQPIVCTAAELGWVVGYDDGEFRPNGNISLVEAVKIFSHASGAIPIISTTPWYRGYIDEASSKNLIPNTVVRLGTPLTRAEVADMIVRYLTLQDYTQEQYLQQAFGENPRIVRYQDLH